MGNEVHEIGKNQTQLSNNHFYFHFQNDYSNSKVNIKTLISSKFGLSDWVTLSYFPSYIFLDFWRFLPKLHNIYYTLIQHTCHLSMSYSHFPLGVKCLKTSVSIYWAPLISQMITVCHGLHHNSAWTLIVKGTKYLLSVYSVAQLCPIPCDSVDCSLPGSSVHEIFQTRILEWVAISSSRESSQTRDRNLISHVSWIGRRILHHCTNREAKISPNSHRNTFLSQYLSDWAFLSLKILLSPYLLQILSWLLICNYYLTVPHCQNTDKNPRFKVFKQILNPQPRDGTQVSHTAGKFFTIWATREGPVDMSLSKTLGESEEEESGVLQSVESQRAGHDLATEHNKTNFLLPISPPFLLHIKFFI